MFRSNLQFQPTKEVYSLDDFEIRAQLGEGSFGKVYLVRLLENPKLHFAMKVMSKRNIAAQGTQRYVKTERDVYAITDHEFILKMYMSF